MRSAGALLASIGTSAVLVAAVVLSLLSVSAVFALGGFENVSDGAAGNALVLDAPAASAPSTASRAAAKPAAVALVGHAPSPSSTRAAQRRSARRHDTVSASDSSTKVSAPVSKVTPIGGGSADRPPATPEQTQPATASQQRAPNLGDGVRSLGDKVSSTLRDTGSALGAATAPLGRPISTALQQTLNLVAGLLDSVTNGLGGVLGAKP